MLGTGTSRDLVPHDNGNVCFLAKAMTWLYSTTFKSLWPADAFHTQLLIFLAILLLIRSITASKGTLYMFDEK